MVLNKFYNFVLSFDLIGPSPKLNFEGRERFSTLIGVFLTLGAFALSCFSNRNSFDSVINNTSPKMLSQNQPLEIPMSINTTTVKMYMQVQYIDPYTKSFKSINKTELPHFLIMKVYYGRTSYKLSNLSNSNNQDSFLTNNCSDKIFEDFNEGLVFSNEKYTPDEIQEIKSNSLCLPSYLNETLEVLKDGRESLIIVIDRPSMVKLSQKYRSSLLINLNYQELVYDPEKYQNPFRLNWVDKYFPVNLDQFKQIRLSIQYVEGTIDLTKFVYPDERFSKFHIVSEILELLSQPNDPTIPDYNVCYYFVIDKDPKQLLTKIQYDSFEMLLSNIGGSLGVYIPIFEYILNVLISPYYRSKTINLSYNFHTIDNDEESVKLIDEYIINKSEKQIAKANSIKIIPEALNQTEPDKIEIVQEASSGNSSNYVKEVKDFNDDRILSLNHEDYNDTSTNKKKEKEDNNEKNQYKIIKIKSGFNTRAATQVNNNNDLHNNQNNNIVELSSMHFHSMGPGMDLIEKKKTSLDVVNNDNNAIIYDNANQVINNINMENKIHKRMKSRNLVKITCWEMFIYNLTCCERKNKNLLIEHCLNYLEEIYEVHNLSRALMKAYIFKAMCLNKDQKRIFKIPSLNIASTSIDTLKITDDMHPNIEEDEDIFPINLPKDVPDINNKLIKNYLNSYI